MIGLTNKEALDLLRSISRIEGYLYSVRGGERIRDDVVSAASLLHSKIEGDKK